MEVHYWTVMPGSETVTATVVAGSGICSSLGHRARALALRTRPSIRELDRLSITRPRQWNKKTGTETPWHSHSMSVLYNVVKEPGSRLAKHQGGERQGNRGYRKVVTYRGPALIGRVAPSYDSTLHAAGLALNEKPGKVKQWRRAKSDASIHRRVFAHSRRVAGPQRRMPEMKHSARFQTRFML